MLERMYGRSFMFVAPIRLKTISIRSRVASSAARHVRPSSRLRTSFMPLLDDEQAAATVAAAAAALQTLRHNATAAASGASDASNNNATAAASGASGASNNETAVANGASDASNNATAAASGAASDAASSVLLDRVAEFISFRRTLSVAFRWRRLLAAHTNRRLTIENGRPIIYGIVDAYATYEQIDTDTIRFTLQIPHSFEYGDDAACGATVHAESEVDGIQLASKMVLAKLFVRDATDNYPKSRLTLHAEHWNCGLADLLREVRNIVVGFPPPPQSFYSSSSAPPQPPLPMPTTTSRQRRADDDLYEPPDDPAQRVEEIKDVFRRMIVETDGPMFDICARQIRTADGTRQKPYLLLARLVEPGKLLDFLDTHGRDEFEYTTRLAKGGEQVLHTLKFRSSSGRGQPAAPHTGSQRWSGAAAAAGQPAAPAAQWYTTGDY